MTRELTDPQRRTVEVAPAQPTAHVWGRGNAGEPVEETGESGDFDRAYAARQGASH